MAMISIQNQKLYGGIALLVLGAAVLFPEMVGQITGITFGGELPIVGQLSVLKIVGGIGAFIGIDMLRN